MGEGGASQGRAHGWGWEVGRETLLPAVGGVALCKLAKDRDDS